MYNQALNEQKHVCRCPHRLTYITFTLCIFQSNTFLSHSCVLKRPEWHNTYTNSAVASVCTTHVTAAALAIHA